MTVTHPKTNLADRLWNGIQGDVNSFVAAVAPIAVPEPGLYTYRVKVGPDGELRIHLRIEPLTPDSRAVVETELGRLTGRDHLLTVTLSEPAR